MGIDISAFKQGQRAMWASGDYPEVARRIESVAELLAQRVEAGPGVRMLDVATGSGNVALAGARAGADVTGLDLTPELLQAARGRAADAGLDVRFVEGDAEDLPFESNSFDVVTSCFGVIFAPRHQQAAGELARVARPGGTIGVTAWTPDGLIGRTFKVLSSFMPPPPPELAPPVSWGTEEHVRELFADSAAELSLERRTVTFTHDSAEGWLDYDERILGPAIMAKAALEPQGRYGEMREAMLDLYGGANEAEDGSFSVRAEYLLTVAKLPA
ncbi:MAG TPA: methyltransferase domain-containing protein [Solirubrobacteraceae bacterium]|jgi:ubiquinone/menaquinone biosynthesis C-methylase UbiE|nr:methyltransferase domain-containing protein [Solirubrobacteraceae bacterium]